MPRSRKRECEFGPESLDLVIHYAAAQTNVHLFTTEIGIAPEDETRRVENIKRALASAPNCPQRQN